MKYVYKTTLYDIASKRRQIRPKLYQNTEETCTLSQPISPLRFALPNWVKNSRASACAAQNMLIKKAKDHHLSTRDSGHPRARALTFHYLGRNLAYVIKWVDQAPNCLK